MDTRDLDVRTTNLATLLLRSAKGLRREGILASYAAAWPGEEGPTDFAMGGGVATFEVGAASVRVEATATPMPEEELEVFGRVSWMWPEAWSALRGHTGQAVVAVRSGSMSAVERSTLLTKVMIALIRAGDAAGVFWQWAGAIHEPGEFETMMRRTSEQGLLPVPLWVNVTMSAEGMLKRMFASTRGLEALGLMELEVHGSKLKPEALREIMYDMAAYVIERGPVLKHGDTFGRADGGKTRIEHCGSRFSKGRRVVRLHA